MPIYDPVTNEELKLGDVLRSFERGDMVYVDELGEQFCAGGALPTIRLGSFADPMLMPFPGNLIGSPGSYQLKGYTKQGAKRPKMRPARCSVFSE